MLHVLKPLVLAGFVLAIPGAFAEPYVGIEYQEFSGTRTQQAYHTNQVNAVVGYAWEIQPGLKHGIEYTGPISSSSAQLGATNVETVIMTFGYRMSYKGLFGKVGYVKLDRDDEDLEAITARARQYSVGYEYALDNTTVLRVARDYLRSNAVSLSGLSASAVFRF
jgi:hypothetical protein